MHTIEMPYQVAFLLKTQATAFLRANEWCLQSVYSEMGVQFAKTIEQFEATLLLEQIFRHVFQMIFIDHPAQGRVLVVFSYCTNLGRVLCLLLMKGTCNLTMTLEELHNLHLLISLDQIDDKVTTIGYMMLLLIHLMFVTKRFDVLVFII